MSDYLEKLKDPRWQKLKALVHIRDDWTCQECGAKDRTLVAHHLSYRGNPWESKLEELTTLCWQCHENTHASDIDESPRHDQRVLRLMYSIYRGGGKITIGNDGNAQLECAEGLYSYTVESFERHKEEITNILKRNSASLEGH